MRALDPQRLLGWLGLCALVSCTSDATSPEDGFVVNVRYDSSLDVAALEVWPVGSGGQARTRLDAPLLVGPPGLRTVPVVLGFEQVQGATSIQAEGFDAAQNLIGSAAAAVSSSSETSVRLTLVPPGRCGDGRVQVGAEACDDGNDLDTDGCTKACAIEPGWVCSGNPSQCGRCGDGTVQAPETCDDGNVVDGDGCSAMCQPEQPGMPNPRIHMLTTDVSAVQTTVNPEFEDVPSAVLALPETSDDGWVVFASGSLGSSSEAELTAEVRMMVGARVVDEFGHQTFGMTDSYAGFVTFEYIPPGLGTEVRLQFRAIEGETSIRDVRLVAARLPADTPVFGASAASKEASGVNLSLVELNFDTAEAGEWVILGRSSLTESPGADSARVWLVDAEGERRPLDDRGVSVSSPRDARLPFFVAAHQTLEAGPVNYMLRGTSSGAGDVSDWWNSTYRYRHSVEVEAVDPVSAGYAVPVTFDHAALVEAGQARADGRDVRAVYFDGMDHRQLARVLDPDSDWNRADTTVWIPLGTDMAAAEVLGDHFLYFGRDNPPDALADPAAVFAWFDDFDAPLSPDRWPQLGANVSAQNGAMVLAAGDRARSSFVPPRVNGRRWEARVRLSDAAATPVQLLGVVEQGAINNDLVASVSQEDAGSWARSIVTDSMVTLETVGRWHRYAIDATAAALRFQQDGTELASHTLTEPVGDATAIFFENGSAAQVEVDWVMARPVVAAEPRITVGPLSGRAGLDPSRWRYSSVLAISAKGFFRTLAARTAERQQTALPESTEMVGLTVPAVANDADHLVIQALRVSGDNDPAGRKVGELLKDGEPVLATSHKINRDSTAYSGYHHTAGAVYGVNTKDLFQLSNAIRSPDGIGVDGAEAVIIVLGYPPAPN